MKAPDKIYINKHMLRPGMLYPAQKPADTPEFEYIRKDALLEWAEEQEKQALEDLENGLPLDGKLSAFHRVVEKIESM